MLKYIKNFKKLVLKRHHYMGCMCLFSGTHEILNLEVMECFKVSFDVS